MKGDKPAEHESKNLGLWLDFAKFILGSVVVVIVTALLNFYISQTQLLLADKQKTQELELNRQQETQELELEKLQNERTFLATFIKEAIDENLDRRISFAYYFSEMTDGDEPQGKRWDEYHKALLMTATAIADRPVKLDQEITKVVSTVTALDVTAVAIDAALKENNSSVELQGTATAIATRMKSARMTLDDLVNRNAVAQQEVQNQLTPVATPTPIPQSTPAPITLLTWLNLKDNARYIQVPPDNYSVASRGGEVVRIENGYWIKQTEVTNAEYQRCIDGNGCTQAPGVVNIQWANPAFANHPVTNIKYEDAEAYATWAGGHLPTRDEWEIACAGKERRIWPWGSSIEPNPELLNFNKPYNSALNSIKETSPVGSYPKGASPFGVLDMAGNVYEITNDKQGDGYTVIRGGGINDERSDSAYLRCSFREGAWVTPGSADDVVGFRIVLPMIPAPTPPPTPNE